MKITEWRKSIIEANPYKVVKKNVHFSALVLYQALHLESSIYQCTNCTNILIWNQASTNIIFQLKQRGCLNKGHVDMYIPDVEEVLRVSRYPLPESMDFDTAISDGVTKMRAATFLGEIVRLHQRTAWCFR